MGYYKKTVVSLFTCALLIHSLLTPYVTATYLTRHTDLNQTDREVGNVDVQGNSKGYMSQGVHVPEAFGLHRASSGSTEGGIPKNHLDAHDFDLGNLTRLFPVGHILSNSSNLQYGLIALTVEPKSGAVDTTSSEFGYLLAVGESHGLTQLQKRDGQPDPFVFIDCPANVLEQPVNQTQKARVVCTTEDVDGCFRVKERGVHGTLVEMPVECAPNSFARAISLELAEDQTMPDHLAERYTPTSPIYEFSFDFNKEERRVDAEVALRMDMTNARGHWDGLGDSPGVKKRDVERGYLSLLNITRNKTLQKRDLFQHSNGRHAVEIKKKLSAPVFWQAAENCAVGGKRYGEGIGAYIDGEVDAKMYYAVTAIATSARGSRAVDLKEFKGFIKVTGQTDLEFGVAGMGRLDISMAGKGNPAKSDPRIVNFGAIRVSAGGFWGYMILQPFIAQETFLATSHMNEYPSTIHGHAATLNGRLTTRVKTDLGHFSATFPHILTQKEIEDYRKDHKKTEMESVLRDNVLHGDGGEKGSTLQIGNHLSFGIRLKFIIHPDMQGQPTLSWSDPTSLLVKSQSYVDWDIPPAENQQVCPSVSALTLLTQEVVGRDFHQAITLYGDKQAPYHEPCYSIKSKRGTLNFLWTGNQSGTISTNHLNKRGLDNPEKTFGHRYLVPMVLFAHRVSQLFHPKNRRRDNGNINCDKGRCGSCLAKNGTDDLCCGCVCMQCKWGPRGDMPPCEKCTDEGIRGETPWPEGKIRDKELLTRAPDINKDWKDVKVCGRKYLHFRKPKSQQYKYPQFPQNHKMIWDGADGGIYDSISRYWGNRSADCADWSIDAKITRDQIHHDKLGLIAAPYQTEHVYEGQNLGQFFTEWLTNGKIKRQRPDPGITTGKVDCAWIQKWIMTRKPGQFPWSNPADPIVSYSLFGTLWTELGNNYHHDRLAILQHRLNRKKENIFDLKRGYSDDTYKGMTTDEQWSAVKEIGLTFSYMNNDTIWGMWCDTYKGVYDRLDGFDKWYALRKGPNDPDVTLAVEWGKYNRIVLDSAVRIYRDGWDWTFANRRSNNALEEARWQAIRIRNRNPDVFHLKKFCLNLPPTTIV